MAEPTFDHERLDVYQLSIDYVAFSFRIAGKLSGVNRQARDQWLRAAQSIPLNRGSDALAAGEGCALQNLSILQNSTHRRPPRSFLATLPEGG